ncbi:MAG: hypothetical protein FIA99_06380 [Ruminiclostridium sp.]|nr:hypothetical protein [Ruminiclostridium sp.]
MKKLAWLILLAGMIFAPATVSHAESVLSFEYNGKTYTVEQASSPESGFPFDVQTKDGLLLLSDKALGFSAFIRQNSLDKSSMGALRKYYNDYSSIDFEIFTKYIDLQKSYIPALQDLYRSSYLFGNPENPNSETNMKVFYQDKDEIFGNKSDVILYNIINSDRLNYSEETHLDMIVPVYSDLSLISINFTFKAGNLNKETEQAVYKLLSYMRFTGFPVQTGTLKVFDEKEAVIAANAGIYKTAGGNSGDFTELKDETAGFTLKYPSSYLPYMENKLGGKLNYKSFKISPRQVLSISAEQTSATGSVYDKASYMKELYKPITVKKEGKETISGNEFVFLIYELKDGEGNVTYIKDYFTAGDKFIYNIRLSSRFEDASAELDSDFHKILSSFIISDAEVVKTGSEAPFIKYSNKEEGYSFLYPVKWKLTDVSKDINFDSLSLKIPELSGPIDIYISEGELKADINPEEIPSILSGVDAEVSARNTRNYTPPYTGTLNRLLSHSFQKDNEITYVYRLVNYMDSNGRPRLCYSKDIVKKNKIYSMFISVSEYATLNGSVSDTDINTVIEKIASSFKYEGTYESNERDSFGETRNRKVVKLENILKQQLGRDAKIVQAVNTSVGGSYFINVEGVEDSGYYRVKPDFTSNSLFIEEALLKKDCKSALEEYLSTDVNVYFPSGDEFKNIENQKDGNGHYTMVVYTEFNNTSGFFILDIDPNEHLTKAISFKSSKDLAEEISAGIAQNAVIGFIINNSVDRKDFTLNFHFYSSIIGHFFRSYMVVLNPETLTLEYSI